MKPARTLDWPRTHRYDALSNDAETSSQRLFCPDCIIATPGYDFREGQYYESRPFDAGRGSGVYRITQLLPPEGDDFQYKIKSAAEPHERVVKESQLDHAG